MAFLSVHRKPHISGSQNTQTRRVIIKEQIKYVSSLFSVFFFFSKSVYQLNFIPDKSQLKMCVAK